MSARAKTTHAEHQVNHLRKQLAGHVTLIADLQGALRTFQERALGAEGTVRIMQSSLGMMEHIAQKLAAELPEERRAHYVAQYP